MSLKKIRRDMARKNSMRSLTIEVSNTKYPVASYRFTYGGWHDPYGPEREFKFGSGFGYKAQEAAINCWKNFSRSKE